MVWYMVEETKISATSYARANYGIYPVGNIKDINRERY